jgi:WD40 repeat protein
MDTGKLVAGPFKLKSEDRVGAVRFSPDSKKLAVKSDSGRYLEVRDVQSQKLDVKVGVNRYRRSGPGSTHSPVFWTKNKTIIAAFSFTRGDGIRTIYEFDPSTLVTVGTPFQGHTGRVTGLALSFDDTLLTSASHDSTIKLWPFESRQLLASFDVQNIFRLVLSPNSRQLAYTVAINTKDGYKICICDTPPDVLAKARVRILRKHVLFMS